MTFLANDLGAEYRKTVRVLGLSVYEAKVGCLFIGLKNQHHPTVSASSAFLHVGCGP